MLYPIPLALNPIPQNSVPAKWFYNEADNKYIVYIKPP